MDMSAFSDPILRHVFLELTTRYECHTVILYGSRARGDFTGESDYDVMGIRAGGEESRIGETVEGHYVDAFVYPEVSIIGEEREFLRLLGGKILVDRDGFGASLLERIKALHAKGPEALPAHERNAQKNWVLKTLARAKRGGVEGDFRRAWLLNELLALYFQCRGEWYRGPKESFRELESQDPEAYRLYATALSPGAPFTAIETLAHALLERIPENTHV